MPEEDSGPLASDADATADGDVLAEASAGCASDSSCGQGQFCKKTSCGDALGICAPSPTQAACMADHSGAVCGCDHVTYPNASWAEAYGENVFAAGECALPAGPCASQDDCGGAAYASVVFCRPSACGQSTGTCAPVPGACEYILDQVCGCDGNTYINQCFALIAQVTVAYGGPCRSGAISACNGPTDCQSGQSCVTDPPGCVGGGPCPGVCLATSGESCGGDEDAGVFLSCGGINSPKTQQCVASACADGVCMGCVFTTGAPCGPDAACPTGQLCVPAAFESGGVSQSFCVVP